MNFNNIKWLKITDLGISQLYLNEQKIKQIQEWFSPNEMENFEPLPVHDFGNGRYTLTDGHTRAYVAYISGLETVPVVYDNDELVTCKIGQALYREDIVWCERFNIEGIPDLQNRIISNEKYQELWLERCNLAHNLISQTNEAQRKSLQNQHKDLYLFGSSNDLKTLYFENKSGEFLKFTSTISRR